MRTTVLVFGALLLASSASAQDLNQCVNINTILNTIISNVATCGQTFVTAIAQTELQPFCSDLFRGLKCAATKLAPDNDDECFEKMIAYIKQDPSSLFDKIKPLLSGFGVTDIPFADQVGQCNIYKSFSQCVDINAIFNTVVNNTSTCRQSFITSVTQTELQPFCDDLFRGLKCVATKLAPDNDDECFKKMIAYIKEDPSSLFNKIKPLVSAFGITDLPFADQVGQCNIYKDDGGDDDDDSSDKDSKDEEWNTACPKIENEGGFCPQDVCTADSGCPEKHTCCSVGGNRCRQCIPDMRQCGDFASIFANQKVRLQCLAQQVMSWRPGNATTYCRFIWNLVDCFAENIVPGTWKNLCLRRIARLLEESPRDLIRALQKVNGNIRLADIARYAGGTDDCQDNPLSKQPSRPEPDDVKSCFNKTSVLKAAGQCGRLTGTSATAVNCANLKSFIECIANRLSTGKDENVVRKCSGEVYEFIKRNQQNLPNTFGNIDPEKCQERDSVCGKDLTPLDGISCRSSQCPANYECKQGFCCPLVKKGYCPKVEQGDRPVCKKACKMDSECKDDEKCCDGCGRQNKYCMKMETEYSDKSKCEAMLEEGKKRLLLQGICGDGTGLTKLPRCQNNRFSPLQMNTETGRGYCVTEDGTKINGSDFTGNRDCTKVREGSCPPTPAECQTVKENADTCQSNDFRCGDDQKCCTFYEQSTCLKKCVNAQKAQEVKVDDCPDRKCCPMTLCQNKICLKDKTAVCSINSCGKCEAVFYNLKGEKIEDCNEGVPLCVTKRAAAREANAKRRNSDYERLSSFMKARDNRDMSEEEDDDDDDDERDDDNDDDKERSRENMRDEYDMEREDEDKLPDDENDEMEGGDMENTPAVKEAINRKLCALFDNLKLCQHGGTCSIGSGESFWEVCKCASGYSGLFCETQGTVSPKDTMCNRDSQRVETITDIFSGSIRVKEKLLLQEVLSKLAPPQKIFSIFTCDANGDYEEIQMGYVLPHTLNSAKIYYCVDKSTGIRRKGTPATPLEAGQMPDCTVTDALPDIMSLPRKCMVLNTTVCSNKDDCEYFWNQETGTCDKGKAMGGFIRLTECYDQCSIQRGCTNDPSGDKMGTPGFVCQRGILSGPKPCRLTDTNGNEYDTCDYERAFCEVSDTSSGHIGMCKTFPRRCLDRPESGYGDRMVGAYYFNTMTRTCKKFQYSGMGGLLNRFYSLQQCHTECNTHMSKYDDAVCPLPKLLAMSVGYIGDSKCDSDGDCGGEDVCCYNGKDRVCTSPVRTCASGLRCSLLGSCLGDKCVCDDCTDVPVSAVCGTDGQTYQSACHLRRKSCQMMQNITVAFNGACKTKCGETQYCEKYELCENNVCKCPEFCTEQYQPVCAKGSKSGAVCSFSNECKMNIMACETKERYVKIKDELCSPTDPSGTCRLQCTKEYSPVCVIDATDVTPKQTTYGNACLLREAMLNGRKIKILTPGQCTHKCGASSQCPFYKPCMNGECKCPEMCTLEYRPVCAHPQGNDGKLTTFSNRCFMNQQACTEDKLYFIVKHGPCIEPKPELQCPQFKEDIPYSGTTECKTENSEGCDTENGEKCCSYGSGQKCIPKNELVRLPVMKDGVCPSPSGLDFDEGMCESKKCMHDDDCGGEDSKCCKNPKCGHMTCTASLVRHNESPCPDGSVMTNLCDPSGMVTGCLQGGTCKTVKTNVSVCCVPKSQLQKPETGLAMARSYLCKLLDMAGITCANGGTCIGNIRDGKVCQCKEGFFGPLCRDYIPKNCTVQAACAANPCDVTTCPGVPDATCVVNTCELCSAIFKNGSEDVTHLCHATPCLVRKAIMTELEDAISKETETTSGEGDIKITPFTTMKMSVMKALGLPGEKILYDDLCTTDGHFKPEQCVLDMKSVRHCFCVNTKTGLPIPNGPKVNSLEGLMCAALNDGNTGIQKFCFQQPSKRRCNAPTRRFFFNTRTMDCEEFHDYGCDFENGNNFVNYRTCKNACGVKSSTLSKCAAVKCGFGQQCRIVDGNPICQEPDKIAAVFEPICDADGNFHPKQCHDEICRCVNTTTGQPIANSEATGQNLMCEKAGNTVKVNRTKPEACEGNTPAVFCENGGKNCKNCQLDADRQTQRADDETVDSQNVCKSCKTCSAEQRRQTCKANKLCVNKCKGFPTAVCRINMCSCDEEYWANGRKVNCSELYTDCEIEQHNAYLEEKAQALKENGKMPENRKQIKCSKSNGYLAVCYGNKCQCLNSADGTEVGVVQSGKNLDTIDCKSVQRETIATSVNVSILLTRKMNLNQLTQQNIRTLRANTEKRLLKKYSKYANSVKFGVSFRTGSIIGDVSITCVTDCADESGSIEISAIGSDILRDVNEGEFVVETEDTVFVASEGSMNVRTGESPVTGPPPKDDDDDKSTVIIVVIVVVAVVCLLAIAVACYCYSKANKTKNKDIPFSDIQGKSNPAYDKA